MPIGSFFVALSQNWQGITENVYQGCQNIYILVYISVAHTLITSGDLSLGTLSFIESAPFRQHIMHIPDWSLIESSFQPAESLKLNPVPQGGTYHSSLRSWLA
ncbi:unnamed protein product [Somion occarium]|uniref:Uncharacterized protein n=1 Tax=Somion occarium TaxID=3059160 RepID=A0ABP1D3D1_9APHY